MSGSRRLMTRSARWRGSHHWMTAGGHHLRTGAWRRARPARTPARPAPAPPRPQASRSSAPPAQPPTHPGPSQPPSPGTAPRGQPTGMDARLQPTRQAEARHSAAPDYAPRHKKTVRQCDKLFCQFTVPLLGLVGKDQRPGRPIRLQGGARPFSLRQGPTVSATFPRS